MDEWTISEPEPAPAPVTDDFFVASEPENVPPAEEPTFVVPEPEPEPEVASAAPFLDLPPLEPSTPPIPTLAPTPPPPTPAPKAKPAPAPAPKPSPAPRGRGRAGADGRSGSDGTFARGSGCRAGGAEARGRSAACRRDAASPARAPSRGRGPCSAPTRRSARRVAPRGERGPRVGAPRRSRCGRPRDGGRDRVRRDEAAGRRLCPTGLRRAAARAGGAARGSLGFGLQLRSRRADRDLRRARSEGAAGVAEAARGRGSRSRRLGRSREPRARRGANEGPLDGRRRGHRLPGAAAARHLPRSRVAGRGGHARRRRLGRRRDREVRLGARPDARGAADADPRARA
jgi:hypothetical protein